MYMKCSHCIYIVQQSYGRWTELSKCYPRQKGAAYYCITMGKVHERWLLTIPMFFAMAWPVMVRFKSMERGLKVIHKPAEKEILTFGESVANLGKVAVAMKANVPTNTRAEYIDRVKLIPLFMYMFVKIRAKTAQPYFPDMKQHQTTGVKQVDEVEEATPRDVGTYEELLHRSSHIESMLAKLMVFVKARGLLEELKAGLSHKSNPELSHGEGEDMEEDEQKVQAVDPLAAAYGDPDPTMESKDLEDSVGRGSDNEEEPDEEMKEEEEPPEEDQEDEGNKSDEESDEDYSEEPQKKKAKHSTTTKTPSNKNLLETEGDVTEGDEVRKILNDPLLGSFSASSPDTPSKKKSLLGRMRRQAQQHHQSKKRRYKVE
jgi:hypothetical protein